MADDLFATPPMSGNVPYKDLEAEVESVETKDSVKTVVSEVDQKTKTLKMYIIGLAVALGFIMIILLVILIILTRQSKVTPIVTVTPTPVPTTTPQPTIPQSLKDRLDNLEKQSKTTDLKELNLSYPQLDWHITF